VRALVIDDSRAMRAILRKILGEVGFEVFEATSVEDGLSTMAATAGIRLALVDWNLPGLPGIEFVRAIRANPRFRSVRMLMVTTETELPRMAMALEAGAHEYLMKPFTRASLIDKLAQVGATA
jgi:two-component system, chemotaxis family, chemotaxis protein CheY